MLQHFESACICDSSSAAAAAAAAVYWCSRALKQRLFRKSWTSVLCKAYVYARRTSKNPPPLPPVPARPSPIAPPSAGSNSNNNRRGGTEGERVRSVAPSLTSEEERPTERSPLHKKTHTVAAAAVSDLAAVAVVYAQTMACFFCPLIFFPGSGFANFLIPSRFFYKCLPACVKMGIHFSPMRPLANFGARGVLWGYQTHWGQK